MELHWESIVIVPLKSFFLSFQRKWRMQWYNKLQNYNNYPINSSYEKAFNKGRSKFSQKRLKPSKNKFLLLTRGHSCCFTVDRLLNSFNAQVEGSHVFNLCEVENDIFLNSFHHCQTSHYKLSNWDFFVYYFPFWGMQLLNGKVAKQK